MLFSGSAWGMEPAGIVRDEVRLAGAHDVEVVDNVAYVAGKWGAFAAGDVSDLRRAS